MVPSLLIGKVLISAIIKTLTGIRVGGSGGGLKIGGIDLPVIKDAEGVPYIPGSSLRGKLRSLYEKAHLSRDKFNSKSGMHSCPEKGELCEACKIWGLAPQGEYQEATTLTRLFVRDAPLIRESVERLRDNLELAWTEVKTEINIDRLTGTVSKVGGPRNPERVPAGAEFNAEFVFNIYEEADKELLKHLFEAMALLEDDYLGGMGSRGYGKVRFENIRVWWNEVAAYKNGQVNLTDERRINDDWNTPQLLIQNFNRLNWTKV